MNGASDFSWVIYLASAASGVAGGIVYVAGQLVTKEDLKEAKTEIEKDLKKLEIKLESIENNLNGKK